MQDLQDMKIMQIFQVSKNQGDDTDGKQCWRKVQIFCNICRMVQNMQDMQNYKYQKYQGDQIASRLGKTECSGLHISNIRNNIFVKKKQKPL